MSDPPSAPQRPRSAQPPLWRGLLAFVLFVVIVAAAVALKDLFPHLKELGYAGAFLAGLISSASIIFPLPGFAVTFALGGSLPSPLLVGLAAGLGETLGELTGYLAGYSGRAVIENRTEYERVSSQMQRYGLIFIFVLALIPMPAFDLVGIAAGALRIPVLWFLLACWPGKTIKALVVAFAGAGLLPMVAEQLRKQVP